MICEKMQLKVSNCVAFGPIQHHAFPLFSNFHQYYSLDVHAYCEIKLAPKAPIIFKTNQHCILPNCLHWSVTVICEIKLPNITNSHQRYILFTCFPVKSLQQHGKKLRIVINTNLCPLVFHGEVRKKSSLN